MSTWIRTKAGAVPVCEYQLDSATGKLLFAEVTDSTPLYGTLSATATTLAA